MKTTLLTLSVLLLSNQFLSAAEPYPSLDHAGGPRGGGAKSGHADVELPAEFNLKKNVSPNPVLIAKLREIDELESKVNAATISQGLDVVEIVAVGGLAAYIHGLEKSLSWRNEIKHDGTKNRKKAIGLVFRTVIVGALFVGDATYDLILTRDYKNILLAEIAAKKKELRAEIAADRFATE